MSDEPTAANATPEGSHSTDRRSEDRHSENRSSEDCSPKDSQPPETPLRLGLGFGLGVLLTASRFVVPWFEPTFEGYRIAFFGGLLGPLLLTLWWIFWSHAPRTERWSVPLGGVVALGATWMVNHESLGLLWCLGHGLPTLAMAMAAWVIATRRSAPQSRRPALFTALCLASCFWPLLRMEGLNGAHEAQYRWRWTPTREARLLADDASRVTARNTTPEAGKTTLAWPGFRGSQRDGIVRGTQIATDWSTTPPTELWRRPVGPGWSSFAVRGSLVFTQEQRGDDEMVSAYHLESGEPVWRRRNPVRFDESISGAGPRATPTLGEERLFTLGATGILNAIDPTDGTLLWSRDAAGDLGASVPWWGFSASPLLVGDRVVVTIGGQLVAYDRATGEQAWAGPEDGGDTYSSPHRATLEGIDQILLLSGAGAVAVSPGDGSVLWQNPWKGQPLVQPALLPGGDILTSSGEGRGLRRLAVSRDSDGWTVEERWTSSRFKPNFNDFVVHQGHLYGFDGALLACLDLADGERCWKGGRYGQGQLLLLADQDLLLVLSEQGGLVLVEAKPEGFAELARTPAIEGKTWNHPVLVGDRLLVRNGQEMAAFRLELE